MSFQNGLNVTCNEPDHGIFGEKHAGRITFGELEKILPWLGDFDIETGQEMELDHNGIWVLAPVTSGPREMNEVERDEYYNTQKEMSEITTKVVPFK